MKFQPPDLWTNSQRQYSDFEYLYYDARLDKVLEGTGFTSNTKSLKQYYKSGFSSRAFRDTKEAVDRQLCEFDSLVRNAVTLYIRNQIMNGASLPIRAELGRSLPTDWILEVYNNMRQSTILKWMDAIEKVDALKRWEGRL